MMCWETFEMRENKTQMWLKEKKKRNPNRRKVQEYAYTAAFQVILRRWACRLSVVVLEEWFVKGGVCDDLLNTSGLRFLSSSEGEAPLLPYPGQQCLFFGLLCKRACWPSPSARGTTFLWSWACASPTPQWRCEPTWATTSVPTQTSMKSNWRTWLDLNCGKLESRYSFRRGHTGKLLTLRMALPMSPDLQIFFLRKVILLCLKCGILFLITYKI